MKICIVIQSEAFRASAGMRIRYDRFNACLGSDEASIDAIPGSVLLAADRFDHDVYVFCKAFDTVSLLLARRLRAAGKVIGQDFFDDYFSQRSDPRLQRFRNWLEDMAPLTDFVICSTPKLVEVLRPYFQDVPITVVDDPVLEFDADRVTAAADAKLERANALRRIDVVWFGIGDNPFFPVGLRDLAASEWALAALGRGGWEVRLKIVTNRRALEGRGARMLRPIGLGYELVEWTEEAEAEALRAATVAILPVNGQSFSASKSLNRAITALDAGCQVLSVGYELYDRLGEFIYRLPEQLLQDLKEGSCLIGPKSAESLRQRLKELADPFASADRFVTAARVARNRIATAPQPKKVVCLVHGRSSSIDLHKAVSRLGGYSVHSPFCEAPWNYQIRFDLVDQLVQFRIREDVLSRFPIPLKNKKRAISIRDHKFFEVDFAKLGVEPLVLQSGPMPLYALDLVRFRSVMDFITACCERAFGQADMLLSDTSPLGIYGRLKLGTDLPLGMTSMGTMALEHARANEPSVASRWLAALGKWSRRRLRRIIGQGDVATIRGSELFDAQWYLLQNPDVAAAGLDAALHYHQSGWREGRDPGPLFSTKLYLRDYQDVAAQAIDPLIHYLEHGQEEGRRARHSLKLRPSRKRR